MYESLFYIERLVWKFVLQRKKTPQERMLQDRLAFTSFFLSPPVYNFNINVFWFFFIYNRNLFLQTTVLILSNVLDNQFIYFGMHSTVRVDIVFQTQTVVSRHLFIRVYSWGPGRHTRTWTNIFLLICVRLYFITVYWDVILLC